MNRLKIQFLLSLVAFSVLQLFFCRFFFVCVALKLESNVICRKHEYHASQSNEEQQQRTAKGKNNKICVIYFYIL